MYNGNGEAIVDDKNKQIALKYETAKCDGKDGYNIDLTNAQAVNIDNYVQLGNNTIGVAYQNKSIVQYTTDWFELNSTLYINLNGDWNNTINDIFVFDYDDKDKFGANVTGFEGTQQFKYTLISDNVIKRKHDILYYIENGEERHNLDFGDICKPTYEPFLVEDEFGGWWDANITFNPNCTFNQIDSNSLEIIFYAEEINGVINIDPTITIDDVNSYGSANNNVTTNAYPMAHATVSDPSLIFYQNFDNYGSTIYNLGTGDFDGAVGGNVTEVSGVIGSAARFGFENNGGASDKDIDFGTSTLGTSEGMTVGGWFYRNSNAGDYYEHVFERSDFGEPFVLYAYSTSGIRVALRADGLVNYVAKTSGFEVGEWHHIMFTYGDNYTVIYHNGVNWTDSTLITGTLDDDPSNNLLLRNRDGNEFNGTADELMIFNRTLSSAEVLSIYQNTSARFSQKATQFFPVQNISQDGTYDKLNVTTNSTLNFDTNIGLTVYEWNGTYNDSIDGDSSTVAMDDGIVLWTHLDGDTLDYSGLGNDGTVNGILNITGIYNEGIDLVDQTSGVNVNFGDVNDVEGLEEITISFWQNEISGVYPIGRNGFRVAKGEQSGNSISDGSFIIGTVSPGDPLFSIMNETGSKLTIDCGACNIPGGEWHHVIGRYNGSKISIYVDGEFVGGTNGNIGAINNTNNNLEFGASDGNDGFDGYIDEVIIWNRSLSDNEIRNVYRNGRLNYLISDQQNITTGDNQVTTFNISTSTTHTALEFDYFTDTNKFYTPVLRDNIIIDSFAGAAGPADTTPPYFTTIPNNVSTQYPNRLGVDFDATDETGLKSYSVNQTDLFSINSSGYLTDNRVLGVGTYIINVSINDTSDNVNSTLFKFTVIQNYTTQLFLTIDPSNEIYYETQTTITGSGCPSEIECVLYRDSTPVSNPEIAIIDVGSYIYVYNGTANENYSMELDATDTLDIAQITPTIDLYLNNTKGNITIQNGTAIDINSTTNSLNGNISLYVDNILINFGWPNLYNYTWFNTTEGLHNVTAIFPNTNNYIRNSTTYWVNVTLGTSNQQNYSSLISQQLNSDGVSGRNSGSSRKSIINGIINPISSRLGKIFNQISDPLEINDASSRNTNLNRIIPDDIIIDSNVNIFSKFFRDIFQNIRILDSVNVLFTDIGQGFLRNVNDYQIIYSSVDINTIKVRLINIQFQITSSVNRIFYSFRSISNLISISEMVNRVSSVFIKIFQAFNILDSVNSIYADIGNIFPRSISDQFLVSSLSNNIFNRGRFVDDQIVVDAFTNRNLLSLRNPAQSFSITGVVNRISLLSRISYQGIIINGLSPATFIDGADLFLVTVVESFNADSVVSRLQDLYRLIIDYLSILPGLSGLAPIQTPASQVLSIWPNENNVPHVVLNQTLEFS